MLRTGPHTVLVGGTDIVRRLTFAKSPASAPRVELLFVDIEVVEVDAAGHRVTLPGGIVASPQNLTAVITIE